MSHVTNPDAVRAAILAIYAAGRRPLTWAEVGHPEIVPGTVVTPFMGVPTVVPQNPPPPGY